MALTPDDITRVRQLIADGVKDYAEATGRLITTTDLEQAIRTSLAQGDRADEASVLSGAVNPTNNDINLLRRDGSTLTLGGLGTALNRKADSSVVQAIRQLPTGGNVGDNLQRTADGSRWVASSVDSSLDNSTAWRVSDNLISADIPAGDGSRGLHRTREQIDTRGGILYMLEFTTPNKGRTITHRTLVSGGPTLQEIHIEFTQTNVDGGTNVGVLDRYMRFVFVNSGINITEPFRLDPASNNANLIIKGLYRIVGTGERGPQGPAGEAGPAGTAGVGVGGRGLPSGGTVNQLPQIDANGNPVWSRGIPTDGVTGQVLGLNQSGLAFIDKVPNIDFTNNRIQNPITNHNPLNRANERTIDGFANARAFLIGFRGSAFPPVLQFEGRQYPLSSDNMKSYVTVYAPFKTAAFSYTHMLPILSGVQTNASFDVGQIQFSFNSSTNSIRVDREFGTDLTEVYLVE